MKSIVSKLLVGAATLAIAGAPLVASAQDWHHDRAWVQRQRVEQREARYRELHRPVYRRYNEGFYGRAPGGYFGYYHNGGWYRHRRQQAGIWLYF